VVVGRVTEVGAKRWKVDVSGRQDGVLLLSGIQLSDGAQRRRTAEDQLSMRKHLKERDVLSADVHTFFSDGTISLHARSLQYGRLEGGCLATVPPFLVKRLPAHFVRLPCAVSVVIGNNGVVWVSADDKAATAAAAAASEDKTEELTPKEARLRVARVRNAVLALGWALLPVTPASIMTVYTASVEGGVPAHEVCNPAVMAALVAPLTTSATSSSKKEEEDAKIVSLIE
jgi:exosome complex component RRP4